MSTQRRGIDQLCENKDLDPAKKNSKQSGSRPEWKLWVIANYEYAQGGVVFVKEIIEHSRKEKEDFAKELSRCSLGWIVKELFGDQVSVVRRGPRGTRQRAYLNLQRIHEVREGNCTMNDFISRNLPNSWHVIKDGTEQISIIRHERWEFNKQRGSIELLVINKGAEEISLQVRAHSSCVNLKKDLGLKQILNTMPVEKQIVLAIKFIENSALCFGMKVREGENVMALVPHFNVNLRSMVENEEPVECQTVFAGDCLVLAASAGICANCSRLQKVDKNRRKRKAEQTNVHPACNKRFMSKQEIECQLKRKQVAGRNAERRESYWREKFDKEAVNVENKDQEDLIEMSAQLNGNLSKDMQC